jgi:predicted dehydrogenase
VKSKILVIGAGSIGTRHARVLREAGFEVALHSTRPEARAALRAEGWTVPETMTDFPGCRHAIVASRTGHHVAHALPLLEAGMDVLVEKPLAPSAEEGRLLAAAAARLQRKVFCALNLRFSKSLNVFRDWLPRAGRLHAAHVECRSYLPDWRPGTDLLASYSASAAEGGVLRDLIHEIDYAGWLLGWPERVFARFDRRSRLGLASEEAAYLDCELASGANLQIDLDFLSRIPIRKMRAFGEFGTLTWDGMAQTAEFAEPGKTPDVREDKQTKDENLLWQDLAFLHGEAGKLVSVEDALRGLAVCDAARRSAQTGKDESVIQP